MLYVGSNTPSKTFCSKFWAGIRRSASMIIDDMILKKNSKTFNETSRLSTTLLKLFGRHFDVLHNHNNTSLEFTESLLN